MATVTMDIAELDKMREAIEIEKQNVLAKEEQIKKLEKDLYEVQAEKRVIKITESPSIITLGARVSVHQNARALKEFLSNIKVLRGEEYEYPNSGYRWEKFNITLGAGLEKRELVNFEDIKQELRKEAERDVTIELVELRRAKKLADERLEEVKQEYERELNKQQEEYQLVIKDWETQHLRIVTELEGRLDEAITGKKKQTEIDKLNEKILYLGTELEKEKNKKWYHKLFGL